VGNVSKITFRGLDKFREVFGKRVHFSKLKIDLVPHLLHKRFHKVNLAHSLRDVHQSKVLIKASFSQNFAVKKFKARVPKERYNT
jgi:hypothetical protein